jgi:adenosylmethionine-8-amino-7-oxononanoate aminotransferase
VGEKRGLGHVAAIELFKNKETKEPFPAPGQATRLTQIAASLGLIFRPVVNIGIWSPPHILTKDDVDEAVSKLKQSLDTLADELTRSGDWKG